MSKTIKPIFDIWLYERELRDNYLFCRATLIAMNIQTIYKHFNNNHNYNYKQVCNMTDDIIVLNENENKFLNYCVNKFLKKNYKLEIVDKDKLIVKKISNN